MYRTITAIIALTFGSFSSAGAATLDFTGNICDGGNVCTSGALIDQSYGDIAGQVDVIYDANRDTVALENVSYWGPDYETLTEVAYSESNTGMSILFQANAGFSVSVIGFDIAPYNDMLVNTEINVYDTFDESLLFSAIESPVSIAGVTSYLGSWASSTGIRIEFGPDSFDVAIDNIEYRADPIAVSPVPLPGSALMLGSVLAWLFGWRRFRPKMQA